MTEMMQFYSILFLVYYLIHLFVIIQKYSEGYFKNKFFLLSLSFVPVIPFFYVVYFGIKKEYKAIIENRKYRKSFRL